MNIAEVFFLLFVVFLDKTSRHYFSSLGYPTDKFIGENFITHTIIISTGSLRIGHKGWILHKIFTKFTTTVHISCNRFSGFRTDRNLFVLISFRLKFSLMDQRKSSKLETLYSTQLLKLLLYYQLQTLFSTSRFLQ